MAGWLAVWLTSCLVVVVAVVRVIAIFCVAYIRFALKVNFCDVVVVVITAAVVIVIIIVNFYTQLQFRLHFNQPSSHSARGEILRVYVSSTTSRS